LGIDVTEISDQPERPRSNVMWWTRRFGTPLRENFQPEAESVDEFIDLLEQAERRRASRKKGS
jgi:hypothetical protein